MYLFEIHGSPERPVYKLREIYEDDAKMIRRAWDDFSKLGRNVTLEVPKKSKKTLDRYVVERVEKKIKKLRRTRKLNKPVAFAFGALSTGAIAETFEDPVCFPVAFLLGLTVGYSSYLVGLSKMVDDLKDVKKEIDLYSRVRFY